MKGHAVLRKSAPRRLALLTILLGGLALQPAAAGITASVSTASDGTGNVVAIMDATALDPAMTQSYYVAAQYQGQWFFLSPNGWTLWSSGQVSDIPPYATGTGAKQATVISLNDLARLSGIRIFAGYGATVTDMLAKQQIAELRPAPGSPCASLTCGSFSGDILLQFNDGSGQDPSKQAIHGTMTAALTAAGAFSASSTIGCAVTGQLTDISRLGVTTWSGIVATTGCSSSIYNRSYRAVVSYTSGKMTIIFTAIDYANNQAFAGSGLLAPVQ